MPTLTAANDTRPRKRTKRAIETEKRFLEAANDVFWARGFGGATLGQIIEASGQSVGSFYHQFSDKADLLDRAKEQVLEDFNSLIETIDLSREANGSLFQVFRRLTHEGSRIVRKHRGIYRALTELAQNDVKGFGPLKRIAPRVAGDLLAVIDTYQDQLAHAPTKEKVAAAVQVLTTCVMQTGLGLGALFPTDDDAFAAVIANASCGVLGYTGPRETE